MHCGTCPEVHVTTPLVHVGVPLVLVTNLGEKESVDFIILL